MNFTNSQKLACDISRNIAVTAGAGSGKTSVLVRRYLWCLERNNHNVRRIVAITFTEKAAGEMLGRIREQVLQRAASDLGSAHLWEDVLEHLPLANISTIHGFCQKLLREFPIEAGVDPNFEVLDEAAQTILLKRLIDDLLRQEAEKNVRSLRLLAQQWQPAALRKIVQQLIGVRDKALLWAERITQTEFDAYLRQLYALCEQQQRRAVQRIAADSRWSDAITEIREIMPPGDTGKFTLRCRIIVDRDTEFRAEREFRKQRDILAMLKREMNLQGVSSAAWKAEDRDKRVKKCFETLKFIYDNAFSEMPIHDATELRSFQIQQALAALFLAALRRYDEEKAARRRLDFEDLQERALRLLRQPDVQQLLSSRYDYVMVDEFQDTNQLQWEIIRRLGLTKQGLAKDKFCIVGDEKQSIYMFRGAEVSVFAEVRNELKLVNAAHQLDAVDMAIPDLGDAPVVGEGDKTGELSMAENFRSDDAVITFCNFLFSRLFLPTFDPERPYDVPHQELVPRREKGIPLDIQAKPVELMLAFDDAGEDDEAESGEAAAESNEPEMIARRIRELMIPATPHDDESASEKPKTRPAQWKDIAILLRTRTRLKAFEEALRRHGIPFLVTGGIGFFEQQEIYDLSNLLRVLSDQREEIALAGVLRSPLLSLSDDQLVYLAGGVKTSNDANTRWTLWEKLRFHAANRDLIPAELDPAMIVHAHDLLSAWQAVAERIPVTHLLRRVLDDTGLYGILAADSAAEQQITNIEKFIEIARKFEQQGFRTLSDFVAYLDELETAAEREGEAQIFAEGMNVVQVMTIHAAKGLEFPIVFVPELERPFNYSENEAVYLDALSTPRAAQPPDIAAGVSVAGLLDDGKPSPTFLREYLKRINRDKTDAEMKRLFYVACTRARDTLILSGSLKKNVRPNSWLGWLTQHLPLADALEQHRNAIAINGLTIPLLTAKTSFHAPRGTEEFGRSASDSPQSGDVQRSTQSVERVLNSPPGRGRGWVNAENPPQPLPGGEIEIDDLFRLLQHNLRPATGAENERFRLSPSMLHLLFECPRRYYYREVLRLDDILATAPPDESSANDHAEHDRFGAQRGTIIHALFEQRVFDDMLTDAERARILEEAVSASPIPPDSEERQRLDTAIERAGTHYAASGVKDLLARSPQVWREHPFMLRLSQADVSGILDALFRDPADDVYTILDYKTNQVEAADVPAEIRRHGYERQMTMYALAVSRLLHVEQMRGILFFTHPNVRYDTFDFSPSALAAFETELAAALRQLTQEHVPCADDRAICQECAYRRYCQTV
ncbi:putative helicase [Candidatus Moduliflexus flocculans]|uniref:DNA 3'-5' helicase n=1 Tax=Candidatus Moduliflexus flocculans TaxID=1499966 RepID=A0A0S6VVT0_9BACT|nr:putative helicase [Candidatus Moduliflexus flocculans]